MSNVPRPNIVWRGASPNNFTYGRPGASRDGRNTFHHVVGTADSAVLVFNNPSRGASAHFIVTDQPNLIYQCVDLSDTAWADGNWESNIRTIAVEHHGDWRNGYDNPVVRENAAQLAAYLRDQGLVNHPIRHRDVSQLGTQCPADLPVEAIWARADEIMTAAYTADTRPQWLKDRQPASGTLYAQKDGLFLYNLNDPSQPADSRRFPINQSFVIASKTVINGVTYFITKSSTDLNAPIGLRENEVSATPWAPPLSVPPQPATPAWADSLLVNDENRTMYVLRPTQLIDLENGTPVVKDGKEVWYNTGDVIENISAHTIVSGVTYQLTEYSFQQVAGGRFEKANGIKSSDLSVDPASTPIGTPANPDPNAPTPTPEPTPEPEPPASTVPDHDPSDLLFYRVIDKSGVLIGSYHSPTVAYESYLMHGGGKIVTSAGTDVTAAMKQQYGTPPTPQPSTGIRLPAMDSATWKAIVTFIQVNVPILLVWLADPQLISFVTTYLPWLLPVISGGAAVAAFVLGVVRKDVKTY